MIVYKAWVQSSKYGSRQWQREGWFLFGFIPLFTRDLQLRVTFGKKF